MSFTTPNPPTMPAPGSDAEKVMNCIIKLSPAWPDMVRGVGSEEGALTAVHELMMMGLAVIVEDERGFRLDLTAAGLDAATD